MADGHDKNNEEEYQFPEDEYVQAQAEPKAEQNPFGSMSEEGGVQNNRAASIMAKVQELTKNRVVVVVVVVIVLLIILRLFGGHNTKVISTATVSATTVASTAAVASTTIPSMPVVSQPSPQVTSQLSQLSQTVNSNQSTISDLQNKIDSLQQSVEVGQEHQSQVTQAVASLAKDVQALQAKLAPKTKVSKKKAKPVVYYLKAIIPGRAWIYGSNGRQATIAKGDSVKQYGKVLAIEAKQGKVLTSSGKVIQFSSIDR